MPRTKEANEKIRKKRKAVIQKAALFLFCKKGYSNVAMDDIPKKAKISHGLVYHYYSKKSEILDELVALGREKLSTYFNFDELKEAKGAAYFKLLTDLIIKGLELKEEYAYFVCLYVQLKLSPVEYDCFPSNSYYSSYEKHFIEAQENGDFIKGNPKEYILSYFHLINSLVYSSLFFKEAKTIPSSNVIMNMFYKKEQND